MSIETAEELFVEELKDIYSAEQQAVRAYPRLSKAVEDDELKEAMNSHLEQTREQIERLTRVFEILNESPEGKTCEGMQGLLEETESYIDEIDEGPVLDAALLAALQRVEHYEISAYGTAAAFAEATGKEEIRQLLVETLDEEKETDEKLTEVSRNVNLDAIEEAETDEEADEDEEEDEEEAEEEETEDSAEVRASKTPKSRAS